MKWTEVLAKTGVDENQVSVSIKKAIKAYRELEAEKKSLEERLSASGISEEDASGLNIDLAEVNDALETIDEALCVKIQKWDSNKDMYAEKMRKMQDSLKAKKEGKANPPAPAPAPAPEPAPAPAPAPNPEPSPNPEPTPNPEPKKDEGMGFGTVLLGIGLFALSFGVYNHFKNK